MQNGRSKYARTSTPAPSEMMAITNFAPSTFFFIAASLLSSACTSSQMLNPISRSL